MKYTMEAFGRHFVLVINDAAVGIMPIVSQVQQVLRGTLDPRELAPHLATDTSGPAEE
jgi:glycerol-3-phosphate dehydrogenase (NAD(P)+)